MSVYHAAVRTRESLLQLCIGGRGGLVDYIAKIQMSDFNADTGMNIFIKMRAYS